MTENKAVFVGGRVVRTAYLGPTNYKGSRISAQGNWHGKDGRKERAVYPYRAELETGEAHELAARDLAKSCGWEWEGKRLGYIESEDGKGYVFFLLPGAVTK